MKKRIYQFTNLPIYQIRQIVPPELCFTCDVCCRFPEKDSFLAPYFTPDEINAAETINPPLFPFIKGGLRGILTKGERGRFNSGCKITLIPYKEGYICPAFDTLTAHCKLYHVRPIDCMLYPFAIMWDADGKEIVLGLDTKCPYIREHMEDQKLKDASLEIASAIESSPLLDVFSANTGLIGPYQDDVIPLVILKGLTSIF